MNLVIAKRSVTIYLRKFQTSQWTQITRRQKGDRVCIYADDTGDSLAMLSCARIGAIHSVVFKAFLRKLLKTEYLT